MWTIRQKLMRWMMILTMGSVAGTGVECDLEDGELEIDLPDLDLIYDDYYYGGGYYYEEVYYDDVWYPCCW